MPENATVTDVCKALANARSDSALLTGTSSGGGMTGIVTAIDLTRYAWVEGHRSSPASSSGVFFFRFVSCLENSGIFVAGWRCSSPVVMSAFLLLFPISKYLLSYSAV